jgi:mRNA interferase RelE/StbE
VSENTFTVAWTAAARRALARLPEKAATAAVEILHGSLPSNPHRVGKPLKLGLEGLHSARRGDYRVIYHIDDDRRSVTVVAIEHRSDAYRLGPSDPAQGARSKLSPRAGLRPRRPGGRSPG